MKHFLKGFVLATIAVAIASSGFYITTKTSKAAMSIQGYVEDIQATYDHFCSNAANIRGWVADTNDSESDLFVFFSESETFNYDQVLGQQFTYIGRSDVYAHFNEEVKMKTGFNWPLTPTLNDGQPHTIHIHVSHDEVPWSGSEITYLGSVDVEPINDGVTGSFDGIIDNSSAVSGWAVDLDLRDPNHTRIPVMFYGDGIYMDTVEADNHRQDVLNYYSECMNDAYHGFSDNIDIPHTLRDNRVHFVEAYAVDISGKGMTRLGGFHTWIYEDGTMKLTDLY